jgi:hypothetical protein
MRLARTHSAGFVLTLLGLAVLLMGTVQADGSGGDPPPPPPPGDSTGTGSSVPSDTTTYDPSSSYDVSYWDLMLLAIKVGP